MAMATVKISIHGIDSASCRYLACGIKRPGRVTRKPSTATRTKTIAELLANREHANLANFAALTDSVLFFSPAFNKTDIYQIEQKITDTLGTVYILVRCDRGYKILEESSTLALSSHALPKNKALSLVPKTQDQMERVLKAISRAPKQIQRDLAETFFLNHGVNWANLDVYGKKEIGQWV